MRYSFGEIAVFTVWRVFKAYFVKMFVEPAVWGSKANIWSNFFVGLRLKAGAVKQKAEASNSGKLFRKTCIIRSIAVCSDI